MADKYERMLELLLQADDWVTATELAEQLGGTTRSGLSMKRFLPSLRTLLDSI